MNTGLIVIHYNSVCHLCINTICSISRFFSIWASWSFTPFQSSRCRSLRAWRDIFSQLLSDNIYCEMQYKYTVYPWLITVSALHRLSSDISDCISLSVLSNTITFCLSFYRCTSGFISQTASTPNFIKTFNFLKLNSEIMLVQPKSLISSHSDLCSDTDSNLVRCYIWLLILYFPHKPACNILFLSTPCVHTSHNFKDAKQLFIHS